MSKRQVRLELAKLGLPIKSHNFTRSDLQRRLTAMDITSMLETEMVKCNFCIAKMPRTSLESHQKRNHLLEYTELKMQGAYSAENVKAAKIVPNKPGMVKCNICLNTMPQTSLARHQKRLHLRENIQIEMQRDYVSQDHPIPSHLPLDWIPVVNESLPKQIGMPNTFPGPLLGPRRMPKQITEVVQAPQSTITTQKRSVLSLDEYKRRNLEFQVNSISSGMKSTENVPNQPGMVLDEPLPKRKRVSTQVSELIKEAPTLTMNIQKQSVLKFDSKTFEEYKQLNEFFF